MSAREIYEASIRQLSPMERLRLASMILDELAASSGAGLDFGEEWSDQDVEDLAAFSSRHSEHSAPHEESHA